MKRGQKSSWPRRRITRWIVKGQSAVKKGPMPRGAAGEVRWAVLECGHNASNDGSARRMVRCKHCFDLGRRLLSVLETRGRQPADLNS